MASFYFSLSLILGGILLCGLIGRHFKRMAAQLRMRVIFSTSDLLEKRQAKFYHYLWLQNVFAACGTLLVLAMLILIAVGVNA